MASFVMGSDAQQLRSNGMASKTTMLQKLHDVTRPVADGNRMIFHQDHQVTHFGGDQTIQMYGDFLGLSP